MSSCSDRLDSHLHAVELMCFVAVKTFMLIPPRTEKARISGHKKQDSGSVEGLSAKAAGIEYKELCPAQIDSQSRHARWTHQVTFPPNAQNSREKTLEPFPRCRATFVLICPWSRCKRTYSRSHIYKGNLRTAARMQRTNAEDVDK